MIIYSADALADLTRLRLWLRERDARLIARFATAVMKSDAHIARRPTAHPVVGDEGIRKRLMRFGRYAYVFYFRVEAIIRSSCVSGMGASGASSFPSVWVDRTR